MKLNENQLRKISLQERVKNGINYLDSNHPGWHEKIDLDTLNIEFPSKCIMGQLDLEDEIRSENKFTAYPYLEDTIYLGMDLFIEEDLRENWNILQECWENEIKNRLGNKKI